MIMIMNVVPAKIECIQIREHIYKILLMLYCNVEKQISPQIGLLHQPTTIK